MRYRLTAIVAAAALVFAFPIGPARANVDNAGENTTMSKSWASGGSQGGSIEVKAKECRRKGKAKKMRARGSVKAFTGVGKGLNRTGFCCVLLV